MINREINSSLNYTPAMIPPIQFLQYEIILTEIIYPQFTTLKIISISFEILQQQQQQQQQQQLYSPLHLTLSAVGNQNYFKTGF